MMRRTLRGLFSPPVFSNDENKTRIAGYVHWIALVFMAVIVAYIVLAKVTFGVFDLNLFDGILFAVALLIYGISAYSQRGYVRQAGLLLVTILWLAVNGTAFYGAGIRDSSFLANFAVLLAAGLIIGWKAAVTLSGLTIAIGIGLAYAEEYGISPAAYTPSSPLIAIQGFVFTIIIFAVFIYLLISGLENAIRTAQAGTHELEEANRELKNARAGLESNRNELLLVNEQLKRRAERIGTIANISKTLTLVQDIEQLLPEVVRTISRRFGFYHTGIYLLDDQKEVAILRGASSEGGIRMLKRGHRVLTNSHGTIGFVTDRGEARIALDEGAQPTRFDNPDLPDTRSQLVLPLKVKELVIGALDIQSEQANAFTEEDVSILSILADQVAVAIQNAYSAEQALNALRNAEIASRQLSGRAWEGYSETLEVRGYRYDGVKPEPVKEKGDMSEGRNSLSIPIRVRGYTIGHLKLTPPDAARLWTEDEIAMAEATADRVALALEGARLLDDAQRKAAREAFLSDISAKLGTSFQLDSILRDTVQELGENFANATVSFQLVNPMETQPRDHGVSGNGRDNGAHES
jgi:GAF domain-containing protein